MSFDKFRWIHIFTFAHLLQDPSRFPFLSYLGPSPLRGLLHLVAFWSPKVWTFHQQVGDSCSDVALFMEILQEFTSFLLIDTQLLLGTYNSHFEKIQVSLCILTYLHLYLTCAHYRHSCTCVSLGLVNTCVFGSLLREWNAQPCSKAWRKREPSKK